MGKRLQLKDLVEYSQGPLLYELQMLCGTADKLARIHWDSEPTNEFEHIERNVYIESFALHFRNLSEFLYCNDAQKVSVRNSYKPEWNVNTPKELERDLRRASEQVAHLTPKRLRLQAKEKEWEFQRITQRFLRDLQDLVRALPDSSLGPQFREELRSRAKSQPFSGSENRSATTSRVQVSTTSIT